MRARACMSFRYVSLSFERCGGAAAIYSLAIMSASGKKPFQRLPTNAVPRNYSVELTPDLAQFSFQGRLDVTVEVRGPGGDVMRGGVRMREEGNG